jgi:hypothetical protein
VSTADGEEKPLDWKGREVEFHIDNQTEDIVLTRGTYNLLKGREYCKNRPVIFPGKQHRAIIKASNMFSKGKIRCYLVYELVLKDQERIPIMKNQRAFIAVEVYSEQSSTKCTVSAVVFMVKSSRFTGNIDNVDWLHKDLLQYHVVEGRKTFKFNINGRLLEMNVELEDTSAVRVNVGMKSISEHIKYAPVFHRANTFA